MARNLSTYLEHIKVHSKSTQRLFRTAYRSFAGIEEFIASGPGNDDIYDYLQKWINGSKGTPVTIRTYFSMIKQYLHYRGNKAGSDGHQAVPELSGKVRGGDAPARNRRVSPDT